MDIKEKDAIEIIKAYDPDLLELHKEVNIALSNAQLIAYAESLVAKFSGGLRDVISECRHISFIVMTKNRYEYEVLRDILVNLNYRYFWPIDSLNVIMDSLAITSCYQGYWRISKNSGVSFEPSYSYLNSHHTSIIEVGHHGELVVRS